MFEIQPNQKKPLASNMQVWVDMVSKVEALTSNEGAAIAILADIRDHSKATYELLQEMRDGGLVITKPDTKKRRKKD